MRRGAAFRMMAAGLVGAALLPASAWPALQASAVAPPGPADDAQAEARVVAYIRDHLAPGQPLVVTDLYNKVFTQPAERQALDKLYRAFFRVPLFVAGYREKFGHPPTLAVIAEQFDLRAPGAADVLLRVMESDPRVPRFLSRDPKTGEITAVNISLIREDARFGQALDHQLAGWEGKPAPAFSLPGLSGAAIESSGLAGKAVLLYVWFTGCPPCMQEAPVLAELNRQASAEGLVIVGANADRELGLGYSDAVRERYLREHQLTFPMGHWTKEADAAYGGVSIFPTLFLIDAKGVIRAHWVGYVGAGPLRAAVSTLKTGGA